MSSEVSAPSPKEIERACEKIRAGWTPKQRKLRWWGEKPKHVETQTIRTSDLPDSVAGWIESINIQDEKETIGD